MKLKTKNWKLKTFLTLTLLLFLSANASALPEMRVKLQVSGGGTYDYFYIGLRADATDGFDNAFDTMLPGGNMNSAYISTYIPHPEWNTVKKDFRGDIRSLKETQEWQVVVYTTLPAGAVLTMTSDALSSVPDAYTITIADTVTGQSLGIKNLPYMFTWQGGSSPRYFRITSYGKTDKTPPAGSITINSNAESTGSTSVTLAISARDEDGDVPWMCLSNSGVCTNWEQYAVSKQWLLQEGDEEKVVYAWFKDKEGNVSSAFSDSISLITSSGTSVSSDTGTQSTADSNSQTAQDTGDIPTGTVASSSTVQTTTAANTNTTTGASSSAVQTTSANTATNQGSPGIAYFYPEQKPVKNDLPDNAYGYQNNIPLKRHSVKVSEAEPKKDEIENVKEDFVGLKEYKKVVCTEHKEKTGAVIITCGDENLKASASGITDGDKDGNKTPDSKEKSPKETARKKAAKGSTTALSGKVYGRDGLPVSGCKVFLKGEKLKLVAKTDKSGAYVFKDLPEGEYILRAVRSGYKFQKQSVTVFGPSFIMDIIHTDKPKVLASRNSAVSNGK